MSNVRDSFIIDGFRTAIGSLGGALSQVRADDLAAHVISALLKKYPVGDALSDVILGCANQAGEDNRNIARMALLLAGVPISVPGITVNRLCASGLSAALDAARAIAVGDGDLYIAGGVEQMTRAPYVISKTQQPFGRDAQLFDTTMGWRFVNPKLKERYGSDTMGETAENVAEQFKVSRADQDAFASRSQQKAAKAQASGRFTAEIAPLHVPQGKEQVKEFLEDEFIRAGTTLEVLSKLKAVFKKDGSVTAGNSSGINDGACALLIASSEAAKKHSLKPMARFVASHAVGVEPRIMGMGPVDAVKGVLQRAKLELKDIAIIELNEAFAAQSLACLRELGIADDDPRVNPNGGAIALGHPLGMSGARLLLTASHELHKQNARYALCTMCVGVGQGVAAIIEKV